MINLSKFSETLEELMTERNLNAKTLAQELQIEPSCISRYLNAKHCPTVQNVILLADYFNCSTDYLLGFEDYNNTLTFKPCPPFAEQIEFLTSYFKSNAVGFYNAVPIHKSRYYDWKRGKRVPTLDNIIKIAECFDCRIDFVLGRES